MIDVIDYDIRLVNFDGALSCLSNKAHSFLVRQKDKISIFMENLFPWQKQDEKKQCIAQKMISPRMKCK